MLHVYSLQKSQIYTVTSCRRAAATICPQACNGSARSGSLEPGRPSRTRSANTRHPAGRPHTPSADRIYATDVLIWSNNGPPCAKCLTINLVFSHRELRGICCVLIADPTVEQLSYRSYIAIFLLYKCKQR